MQLHSLVQSPVLMPASFPIYGFVTTILPSRTDYRLLLSVLVVALVLLAASWFLIWLGVQIGRSMQRHASRSLLANSRPPVLVPDASLPGTTAVKLVDNGMPLSPPDLHTEIVRDALTGLWSRDAILDQLRREMSRATRQGVPLGLVMVKLDHFEQLKKDHGDSESEAMLLKAAEHFVEGLREYDAAGRSGTEFLLVLPGWDPDANPQRVDGMLAPIHVKPATAGIESLQITASIGVASFHPSADSPYAEDLLERADLAVHAAQAAGRNRAEFAPR